MATKDYSLISKNGVSINNVSNVQSDNLNLNYPNTFSEPPKINTSKKRKVSDFDSEKNDLQSKKVKSTRFLPSNENELKKKKYSNANSSSILSLHIKAYENSEESNLFNETNQISKYFEKQNFIDSTKFFIQNPFEFSRQQETDKVKEPEVSQYKSSQRLLNPNKDDKKDSKNISLVSTKNEEDEDYRAHLSDPEETPTKVTGLQYGEQLTDDLLNSFCDKVQTAAGEDLEGFMAIQAIQLMPEIIPTIITGKKRVLQIILDSHRKHYILIEWNPKYKDRGAIIWDPLIRSNKDFVSTLSKSFKRQYLRLFDHIYGTPIDGASDSKSNTIPCKLESFVYGQNDNWSCGLRAAATLVLRAFNGEENLHGGEIYISIKKFHEILKKIMKLERKPIKEDFQINYWFKRKNYEYDFAFVFMNKSDLTVYCTYQNYDPKEKNFIKDDENDDISKIKRKLANLKLSAKKSKKDSDDDDEDDDESTTLLSSSSASSEAVSDNEVEEDESQASNHQQQKQNNQKNDNEDDEEEKAADKSLSSSSSHSSTPKTDDQN